MVNDGEARELRGDWNIHRAGRWILAHGPKRVVIKQGEHGALLIEPDAHVLRAGLSAGGGVRPHRRGRRVRRRLHGLPRPHRTRSPRTTSAGRWSYGAAMGSYAVEQFGIRGFDDVTLDGRGAAGARLPAISPTSAWRSRCAMTSAGEYAAAGVDLAARGRGQGADRPAGRRHPHRALGGQGRRLRRDGARARRACGGRRWC